MELDFKILKIAPRKDDADTRVDDASSIGAGPNLRQTLRTMARSLPTPSRIVLLPGLAAALALSCGDLAVPSARASEPPAQPTQNAALDRADRIVVNARVWTGDDAHPQAEALALRGDRLLAVGATAEIRALAGPATEVIDAKGRRVVPGFQDSHLHFPGRSINEVDLAGIESLAEFQKTLADFARAHPDLPWITGHGWGYSLFPNLTPESKHIDAVIADRPVYLQQRDGHMGLANRRALEIAGVTRATPDPPNGQLARNAKGDLTGELKEAAQRLVTRHIPSRTAEDTYQSFVQHMGEAAAAGITSVQNASWAASDQPVYERALAAGAFKVRVRFAPPILPGEGGYPRDHVLKAPPTDDDLRRYRDLANRFPGPVMKFGAVKGMLDGTVDARTAAMFEPYVGGGQGIPFWEAADLNRVVAQYDKAGFQVMLHAIGDKAIAMALDAFENAARVNGTTDRRHRIEHVEVPRLQDLPRFRKAGVIASTQALFAMPDATTLTNYSPLLGPERASHANAFKLFDDAGAVQAFGSDWGVFDFAPLWGIYTAVTRMMPDGTPRGGYFPQHSISVEAALRHYTRDGAFANFDEKSRGTLTAGKLADFVVLSDDILTIPAKDIMKARVLLTVMGGKDTYRSRDW